MNLMVNKFVMVVLATVSLCGYLQSKPDSSAPTTTMYILLGSTRQGRMSDKIGAVLQRIAEKRVDIAVEIVDLRDYELQFLDERIPPMYREVCENSLIKKWSEKISQADCFIMVVPEYNAGYPGVLKNALDSLYKEWNNKPVAFVGYSGGSSGGSSAIAQLRQVVMALQMIPLSATVTIANAWKAFNDDGIFIDTDINNQLSALMDTLIVTTKEQQQS